MALPTSASRGATPCISITTEARLGTWPIGSSVLDSTPISSLRQPNRRYTISVPGRTISGCLYDFTYKDSNTLIALVKANKVYVFLPNDTIGIGSHQLQTLSWHGKVPSSTEL